MPSWGKQHRLAQILNPGDGKCVMLAVDHGYFLGPTRGMEQPGPILDRLLPHTDALMVTRGLLRNTVSPAMTSGIVLRISGGPSVVGPTLSNESITTSIEDAIRVGASAVAVSVFVGSENESQTIDNLAATINRCQEYDLPVLAVTAMGKELGTQDLRAMSLATRICAEIGADLVKTYYADGFEALVESAMVPVVIAGGKKLSTERDAIQLAYDAIASGAAGIDFGRNVWQSDHPAPMLEALRAIVHDSSSVDSAHDLFTSKVAEVERVSAAVS